MPKMTPRFARIAAPSRPSVFRAAIGCRVLVVCTVFAGWLSAQQESALQNAGSIRGAVKDPSGAVVAGAVVTLEADGSREQRTTITDESGQFQFSPVGPGPYTIAITASGFEVWTAKDLAPSSGENPITATLRVAPTSAQVNVALPPRELAVEQNRSRRRRNSA
jgi:hypothetical protein